MLFALVAFFAVPVLLFVVGVVTIVQAVKSLRRAQGSRASAILRVIAGVGFVGCAFISVGGVLAQVQYAIVILPMLGLFGAAVWGGGFLIAAAIVEVVVRRREHVSRVSQEQ
ncbi:hypothetical protein K8P10_000831 [Leucobacter sp. Psy1]|uniref:hypothetical protein n=1 Tax=Leucobacter sp. Psy1 TaxID=2875729 RepID=UPI001CD549EE|nr:hypothetical protein [Leucobacter sp. Psy1]UBH05320.1 hypothetical protein K8P10_000831 [Leucobacter sp. Psy1]